MPFSVSELLFHGLSTLSLQANADPNVYFNGFSPLSAAARDDDTKFLTSLLAAKADPNLKEEVSFFVSLSLLCYYSSFFKPITSPLTLLY